MKKKTDQELIEEYLANGGEVEVLETIEPDLNQTISSITKKVPVLKTLPEAELLYGKKQVKKKKVKVPDYSGIDMNLIPDHLKKRLNIGQEVDKATKEAQVETNQNSRCSKAGNKS